MLVDGFQLALDFKERSPEGYEFFSTCPLESRYLHTASEPHVHYRNRDLVFKMYPNRFVQTAVAVSNWSTHRFEYIKNLIKKIRKIQRIFDIRN